MTNMKGSENDLRVTKIWDRMISLAVVYDATVKQKMTCRKHPGSNERVFLTASNYLQ